MPLASRSQCSDAQLSGSSGTNVPSKILTGLTILGILLILKKYISLGRNHWAVIDLKKKEIITFLK